MKMSEFAQKRIRLDETVSATPGALRLYPYQREMLDAPQEPGIEKVTWLKSSQLGMTTLLDCLVSHYIANDPSSVLYALTRDSDARRAAIRVDKVFDGSPFLRGRLSYVRNDPDNRSTLLERHIPGGSLRYAGVNSADNLRSITAKVLLCDEVSAWTETTEGDPIGLVEMRTATFADRKLIYCSTPTTESECKISELYEQSDKREWRVKCQHCDERWFLTMESLQWESGEPDSVVAVCPSCGGVHTDHQHKLAMVQQGQWVKTAPEVKDHAGFKINALSSLLPTARWPDIVRKFLKAKNDDFELQAFTNTILGETWKDNFEQAVDVGELEGRAEGFDADSVPEDVLLITAGADVQRDRIEVTYFGFTEAGGYVVIAHEVLPGDPNASNGLVWQALDQSLKQTFKCEDGKRLKVTAGVVDSGDGVTVDSVYAFVKPRWSKGIYAGKGMAGFQRPPFELKRNSRARGGARVGLIGTEAIKSMIFNTVANVERWRFSETLDSTWFDQLISERLEVKKRKGVEVKTFVPIAGKRQEALDCAVYAIAARYSIPRLNWENLKQKIADQQDEQQPKQSIADLSAMLHQ